MDNLEVKTASPKPRKRTAKKLALGRLIFAVSILMGSVAGVCVAAVLLWTAWGKDPLGLFAQKRAPTRELASASPTQVQATPDRQATKPVQTPQDKVQKPGPSSTPDAPATTSPPPATAIAANVPPDTAADSGSTDIERRREPPGTRPGDLGQNRRPSLTDRFLQKFDNNNNGVIEPSELPKQENSKIMRADTNSDGRLTLIELQNSDPRDLLPLINFPLAQVGDSTPTGTDAEPLVIPDANSDLSHSSPDESNNVESPTTDIESEPVTVGRLAVPSEADQEQALATIKSLFEEQYRVAKTKEQKLNLASEMIKVSEDTREDIAGKYVLLRVARDIAIAQSEIDLTEGSIVEMESSFAVDGTELRIEAWQELLSNTAASDATQKTLSRKLVTQILQHAEQRFNDTDDDAVLKTIKFADAQLHAVIDDEQQQSLDDLNKAAEARQELLASKNAAELVLDADPLDPEANGNLGRYYCFHRGDWQAGLMYLSRCGDESLRRLAADEMAALDSVNPTAQALDLGDRWWNYSENLNNLKPNSTNANRIKLHASHWYKKAAKIATGLTKKLIEKRLSESNSLSVAEHVKEANAEIPTKLDHSKQDLAQSMFKGRSGAMKAALLDRFGGTIKTQEAVALGLQWLKRNQKVKGNWSMRGPYRDGGFTENETAATAMALLAFLGDGHTHKSGKYAGVVSRGMKYLIEQQDSQGFFAKNARSHEKMYAQAQATIAICELYAMSGDRMLRPHAQLAIDFAIDSQSDAGGWRYEPNNDSDTSVTGWYVMALESGRAAGLKVNASALGRVMLYLDDAASDDDAAYSYQTNSAPTPSPAMTAEGLLCRQYIGWKREHPPLIRGITTLLQDAPFDMGGRDVYYWYYATQVLHHFGGSPWRRWNDVMKVELPKAQVKSGPENGSWPPQQDRWGKNAGRLYTTCLSLCCLEVYYRHIPIYDTTTEPAPIAPPTR